MGRGRGAPSRVRRGEGAGRRRRCRRQRPTESAPRPAPGVGAGDRRAGLGAGAREERLTVKSQAKAQRTQRREHRAPLPPALGKRCPANVGTRPRPAALPTPSQAQSPLPSRAACQRDGALTWSSVSEHPLPHFPHPLLVPEGAKGDLGRRPRVRQPARPACPCDSSVLGG